MNGTALVGVALTALVVGAVAFFAAGRIQTGVVNVVGGREVAHTMDLPWVAPHAQARVFAKQTAGVNTGVTQTWEWGAGRWRTQDPERIVAEAVTFLAKAPEFAQWPESGSEAEFYAGNAAGVPAGVYPVRVAPAQFHLVSIRPTVILLRADSTIVGLVQEHARNPDESQFAQYMRGLDHLQYRTTWQLANPIHIGTRLPNGDGWRWFSPDLGQPPTPLVLQRSSISSIALPDGALVFEADGQGWVVTRR